ncbi:fimbrial family protein [Yersinia pseudotuberculosis IP 32953]|uniref:Frimbrial protein n=1 Tax=Yersinia pseudotuberculosis serotype I (strain IP32953) TaxID=273123 RepID=Q668R7_YERPS|nr:fimbrial protein [Yersinia pseudotuberculosis]CQD57774.1 frimbrial protein [Yersinia intermedia]AJJ01398.1 fimbrial family protein [Yersinia pseudotuberculosis]AJJ54928.1 fimbrial family protein [Yersinia pseudotuberculosis IP 32953]AJJ68833.1 fimbrial family protein [Yersinia pseudotuberculosis PB1/+]AYX17587.1 type 1 fimbrial protein [Yersinia pseudotuberculosis]
MRKLNLAVCAVALSVISATSYAAAGGTVTFNGKLIADTCQVDTASENITVTLPTLSIQSLAVAEAQDGSKDFEIKVLDCPATLTQVGAHFNAIDSSGVNPATGNLVNKAPTDAAGNVEVRLYNVDDSSQIRVGSTGNMVNIVYVGATPGTANLTYAGGYYATDATTPGEVNAKVEYVLAYN